MQPHTFAPRAAAGVLAGRRRRPVPTALTGLVLVAVLAAGCSDDDGDGGEATAGTLDLAPATSTTTPPEVATLLDQLVDVPPLPGFVPADEVLGAGPLDLEAAAAGEQDVAAERALLEETGFRHGASRAWLDPDQAVAYVAVYAFGSPADAEAYLDATTERLAARGASTFDVPGVEGAAGFSTVEESEGATFTADAVTFTRGDRWVLALVGTPGADRPPDDARALAAAQAAALG